MGGTTTTKTSKHKETKNKENERLHGKKNKEKEDTSCKRPRYYMNNDSEEKKKHYEDPDEKKNSCKDYISEYENETESDNVRPDFDYPNDDSAPEYTYSKNLSNSGHSIKSVLPINLNDEDNALKSPTSPIHQIEHDNRTCYSTLSDADNSLKIAQDSIHLKEHDNDTDANCSRCKKIDSIEMNECIHKMKTQQESITPHPSKLNQFTKPDVGENNILGIPHTDTSTDTQPNFISSLKNCRVPYKTIRRFLITYEFTPTTLLSIIDGNSIDSKQNLFNDATPDRKTSGSPNLDVIHRLFALLLKMKVGDIDTEPFLKTLEDNESLIAELTLLQETDSHNFVRHTYYFEVQRIFDKPNFRINVVTRAVFQDAVRNMTVNLVELTNINIFPGNIRMFLHLPVYREGYLHRKNMHRMRV